MLGSNLNEFKFSQIDKNFRFKLRGQKNLHIAMQVSSWKTYLLIYSFFSSVMCSNQDFVLLCVKVREKGKKKKKKARYGMVRPPRNSLNRGELSAWPLSQSCQRSHPRHWVGFYKPYREPGNMKSSTPKGYQWWICKCLAKHILV